MKIAKSMLKDNDSEIVIQTGYHPVQFSKGLFDYIYHEHYSYFSISSMNSLCKQVSMNIDKYLISDLRGGTVRFYINESRRRNEDNKFLLERFTNQEELKGLFSLINISKIHLREIVHSYKKKGYKIVGYGASHSTGILVTNLDLSDDLDYLVDENIDKIDMFMPGTSLKVNKTDFLYAEKKAIVIILAWQYYERIRKKIINNGFKGQIIKPILP